MAKYVWLVFTNSTPGDEEEFNRWYDDVHVPDLLKIPGLVAATRWEITESQMLRESDNLIISNSVELCAQFRYLAQYHLETEDVKGFLHEVEMRANTSDMIISETLGDVFTVMYENRA